MAESDQIRHICYEHDIPLEIEQSIAELYQSAFCVTEYFKLYKTYDHLNALVLYNSQPDPIHIIFYSLENNDATILNELFDIQQFYILHFVDFIFSKYRDIHVINLNRSKCKIDNFPLPYRIWNKSEDTVIQLPASLSEYQSRLGRHTKSNLNNYSNRLRRIYNDFTFTTSKENEVDSHVISKIIAMNRLRMDSKNIKSGFDSTLANKILNFSKKYGFTTTISVNGQIVAGAIYYEVGNHCFLEAISHDPEYNKDRVGQVCLYLTIKHAIEQGREAFHLLWGEYEYKYRFLGVKQNLYSLSIYRSERYKLFSLSKLLKYKLAFSIKQLTYWLHKYIINRF